MGRSRRAEDHTSARTLVLLAGLYAGAAGLHGVLAVRFHALWQVVVAVVLLLAAVGFGVVAARRGRRHRRTGRRSRSQQRVSSGPALPSLRDEHPLPAQRGRDPSLHNGG